MNTVIFDAISPIVLSNDSTIFRTDALINGQWLTGTSRFDVLDPAPGCKPADVANLGPADAQAAIDAANVGWTA
jgi:succinate-semialdehyde dehydrogenase/glutarate-semialdehyde dehydrogenase